MTRMIEVKVAELSGKALAWAVWLADRGEAADPNPATGYIWTALQEHWAPHTDWSQGGPLIEKHNAWPNRYNDSCPDVVPGAEYFVVTLEFLGDEGGFSCEPFIEGPSGLVAAMRAIVRAKLGDVVSVPAELVEGA